MIEPVHETARPSSGPGFSDAVTFAWGDRAAGLYGLARAGIGHDGSALAVLFAGREPVAATARGGIELPEGSDFADLSLAGLHTTVRTPLREWTVGYEGGGASYALTFEALTTPAELDGGEPVARTGGMAGYEQLCRVRGTARTGDGDGEVAIDCLGQRSHTWGEPDWRKLDSTRTISAWLDDGTGVTATAVRPQGKKGHDSDARWAVLLDAAGNVHVDDPRISTTYDGDGRQRRAGLELWLGEDDGYPRRAAGEVICGSTFDLGQLRLDCAFFAWHMEGREGVGRYDIVRHA